MTARESSLEQFKSDVHKSFEQEECAKGITSLEKTVPEFKEREFLSTPMCSSISVEGMFQTPIHTYLVN